MIGNCDNQMGNINFTSDGLLQDGKVVFVYNQSLYNVAMDGGVYANEIMTV